MHYALVVDVRQRCPDGGRLAAQAVVALDVAAVAAGEAGEAAAAEQVTPELEGAAAVGVLVEEERVAVGGLGVVRVVTHQHLCEGGCSDSKFSKCLTGWSIRLYTTLC